MADQDLPLREWKSSRPIAIGTAVRFKETAMMRMSASEKKRMAGRIGKVSGYRLGASAPIVTFPKQGRYAELKLFEVRVSDLDVISDATS